MIEIGITCMRWTPELAVFVLSGDTPATATITDVNSGVSTTFAPSEEWGTLPVGENVEELHVRIDVAGASRMATVRFDPEPAPPAVPEPKPKSRLRRIK